MGLMSAAIITIEGGRIVDDDDDDDELVFVVEEGADFRRVLTTSLTPRLRALALFAVVK